MVGAALSIKLRCASWQQLATIYRRDLSRGAMFLKAATQPPLGTPVRIDLELPSATVIELSGKISRHVVDPQRGTGVELALDPLPTRSVWLIESALAAETKVRAQTGGPTPPAAKSPSGPQTAISDGEEIASAEQELIRALEAEADSLRRLNPFLVLGVGYETTDADVRAAFGELTKRYHPDRFARYQSAQLRQLAAEIFILIRDAYRKLASESGRAQVIATLSPRVPTRAQTQPRTSPAPAARPAGALPRVSVPPVPPRPPPRPPGAASAHDTPTKQNPHDAPTNPSGKTAALAHTHLARPDDLAIPVAPTEPAPAGRSGPLRAASDAGSGPIRAVTDAGSGPARAPAEATRPAPDARSGRPAIASDPGDLEALIDAGKLDEALAAYQLAARKHPQDRTHRAGIELCEGLRALAQRDRLEAAQRFESALELDPSNERAARELAEMRRQATNERKGLLSRLMGKKEPP